MLLDVSMFRTSLLRMQITESQYTLKGWVTFLSLVFLIQSVIALNKQLTIRWFSIEIVVLSSIVNA